jgi:diadenylate cyclase
LQEQQISGVDRPRSDRDHDPALGADRLGRVDEARTVEDEIRVVAPHPRPTPVDLVVADYLPVARDADDTLAEMMRLSDEDLRDLRIVAATLHRGGDVSDLDAEVAPKGLRLLRRVHRLDDEVSCRIANHFGRFSRLQRATVDELTSIDGVDTATAQQIRETLTRVTESTILDQYN